MADGAAAGEVLHGRGEYESLHAALRRLAARVAGGRLGDRCAAYALAAPDLVVLAGRILADRRVPRSRRGEILASVVYLASPIDVIPEALFGPLGLVDDAVVAARLFDVVLNKVDVEIVREHWPGDRAVLQTLQGVAAEARKVFAAGFGQGVRVLARRGARELQRLLSAAGVDPARLLGSVSGNPGPPQS